MVKTNNNRANDKQIDRVGYKNSGKGWTHALYLILLLLVALPCAAQVPVALSPQPKIQFLDASGRPLAGGFVYTYNAGTNTPAATYVDSTGTPQNTNPIVLDAGGFANIWLAEQSYKVCVADLNNVQQYCVDNISAFSVLNQTNTWTSLQIFSGGITVAGTLTSTGTFLCHNFQSVRCVASFPGSDWGTKVNNADADLGANAGELWIDQSAGLTNLTPIVLSANHTLRFIQGGVYRTAKNISLGANAGIVGPPMGNQSANNVFGGQAVIEEADSAQLPALVTMTGGSNFISNMVVDGDKGANFTEGVGILVNQSVRVTIQGSAIQDFKSHGISLASTLLGNQSAFAKIQNTMITANDGDGIYSLNTSDLSIGEGSELVGNGIGATVSTSGVSVTITSSSVWSTDSSLVGTQVRINGVRYVIAAIADGTHLTLAASAGTQTGVAFNSGSGLEAANSPNFRINNARFNFNEMDGILAYGTTAGLGSSNSQVTGNQFASQFQNDIEVVGYDTVGGANVAFGWTITGNTFIGSLSRTPTNTYDEVFLQDGGQHSVTGNSFISNNAPNAPKYGIEVSETAPNRALPSYIGENTFGNSGTLPTSAVTAATEAANTVTLTVTSNPIVAGQTTIVSGVTPGGYNGTFLAIAPTNSTTLTYSNPTTGLGAGTAFGTVAATPTFGTATVFDGNNNASNGFLGQLQAPQQVGDVPCAAGTPPQWSDCFGALNSIITFTSTAQTGNLTSTPVIATTLKDGFWIFSVTANVTASSPTPSMFVNIGPTCTSTTNTSLGVGVQPFGFPASSTNFQCVPTFLPAGSAINVSTTVGGSGSIAYTLTVKAKFID